MPCYIVLQLATRSMLRGLHKDNQGACGPIILRFYGFYNLLELLMWYTDNTRQGSDGNLKMAGGELQESTTNSAWMLRRSILAVQNSIRGRRQHALRHEVDCHNSNFQLSYRNRIQVCLPDAQRWRRRRMSVIRGFGLRQSSNPWSIGRSGSGRLNGQKFVEVGVLVKCGVRHWKWLYVSKRRWKSGAVQVILCQNS